MMTSPQRDISLINPNWSAFVLLVTLLSSFNSLAILILPLADDAEYALRFMNGAITFVLWADFVYLLRGSSSKRDFMVRQRGWMVLLGSMPLLRVFRILWFQFILRSDGRTLRDFLSRIVIRRNAEGTVLLILFSVIVFFEIAVVSILSLEAVAPNHNIASFSDALWWAFATVTTVGYGDKYPVTNGGRVVAVLLMAVGIALFSAITGSLSEWFRSRQAPLPSFLDRDDQEEAKANDVVAEMRRILEQQEQSYQETIVELRERLVDLETRL